MKRFAIFILSHGRADTITTYRTFREAGYTGDMFVVIDNEDDDEPKYREQFGDDIIMFNKKEYADRADLGDLDTDRRIGVLARNFIQDEAKRLGYKFHLQLDDDIHGLSIRYEKGDKLKTKKVKDIDKVLDGMCEYMENTKITSLSFGLFAYYMGGVQSSAWKKQMIPKTMTTFMMRADDINYFKFRMNDDITTSAMNGSIGKMYYTYMPVMLEVDETQAQKGGMTEIYLDNGTYRKSFYSVMAMPSCASISSMGIKDFRCHHEIKWNKCTPKILSERWKK